MMEGRQLARVLRAENEALRAHDAAAATSMLLAKQEALRVFQAALKHGVPDTKLAAELRELSNDNAALLVEAMEVQGRIMEMVARAARQTAPGSVRYGARGMARPSGEAMSLALNA